MDINIYSTIVNDKDFLDLKKLRYKYPEIKLDELMFNLKNIFYSSLPIKDFKGNRAVYSKILCKTNMHPVKLLLKEQKNASVSEDEILSTLSIENINSTRESVRKVICGKAPETKDEEYVYGIKKGIEFVSDKTNKITEENLRKLYDIAVGNYTEKENKLLPQSLYRHDAVYIIGSKVEHTGISHTKLNDYMKNFVDFINSDFNDNELIKSAIIHFYMSYIHPYFDGNGRMARLLQMWYLVQNGFSSATVISFSRLINESKNKYYKAFSKVEQNFNYTQTLDITPFIVYFADNVFNKIQTDDSYTQMSDVYNSAVEKGLVTQKEVKLWNFVMSVYGSQEFSTKQLEKDFGDAAYATIRAFVLKFEKLGLFTSAKYSNRVKYRICQI